MRTLRTLGIAAVLALCAAAARADDTKPPAIGDVKASPRGGKIVVEAKITDETGVLSAVCFHRKAGSSKWDESPMVKNEFDDTFKVSFSGSGEIEYYLQATDILGNGPSSWGSVGKPMVVTGRGGSREPKEPVAVAEATPPPEAPAADATPPPEAPPPEPKKRGSRRRREAAPPPEAPAAEAPAPEATPAPAVSEPPVIAHRKPMIQLPEGQEFKLRITITASAGIKNAVAFVRPAGTAGYKAKIPMAKTGDTNYEVLIPAELARGDVEYFLSAQDNEGRRADLGDGDKTTWFKVSFKGGAGGGGAVSSRALVVHAGYTAITDPRKPILLRAQVSPGNLAELTEQTAAAAEEAMGNLNVRVLWREKDGEDQEAAMQPDPSGGLGGYSAQLGAQFDGTIIYYQVVACTADGKCAVDTGSKRRWNWLLVSSMPTDAPPALDAVSTKAPTGL